MSAMGTLAASAAAYIEEHVRLQTSPPLDVPPSHGSTDHESTVKDTPPPIEPITNGAQLLPEDENLGALGGGMREMVDLVNRLRASGIEDLGLPLPRIAVVGNQSAGKSSLIEAISGIKVPRYSGTCTRCPLEINLKEAKNSGDSWHCKISLRFKKRYDPTCGPGNPWADMVTHQVHFTEITDKADVEAVLTRAQTAILNPSSEWSKYLSPNHEDQNKRRRGKKSREEWFEVKFSPNVVCMDITGPDLPNLAFIDLPGVIQSTENEAEHYLIDLVTDLVKEYVSEQDCLILLAMTMKDDAVNQSAGRLAREFGEDRTIGALTKPDTVEDGEHNQWISILRGQSHKLKHGYFVTKQPNQDALNKKVDTATAREQEETFFKTREPWATELKDLQSRFGTPSLARYLAGELGKLIRQRLPLIITTIESQLQKVRGELARLPVPVRDRHVMIVDQLLTGFATDLRYRIQKCSGKESFGYIFKKQGERFTENLRRMKPGLIMLDYDEEQRALRGGNAATRPDGNKKQAEKPPTDPNHTTTHPQSSPPPIDGPQSAESTPTKKRPAEDDTADSSRGIKKPRAVLGSLPMKLLGVEADRFLDCTKYTLPQLRQIIEGTSTSHVPNQIDAAALDHIVVGCIKKWDPLVKKYFTDIRTQVAELFRSCFEDHFKTWKNYPVFDKVFHVLESFLVKALKQQQTSIDRIYKYELAEPVTINKVDFQEATEKAEKVLQERRTRNVEEQQVRLKRGRETEERGATPTPVATPTASTRRGGRGRSTYATTTQDNGDPDLDGPGKDIFKQEIQLLAQAQAYHEIARKRFADNLYISFQREMLEHCKQGTLAELQGHIGVYETNSEPLCRGLLREDPATERRRNELTAKEEQLTKAMEELNSYIWRGTMCG